MATAIPDRWTMYKPVGEKIEGTRFIAFKVPLREHISNRVDSDIRLDGTILLKSIPNLGLIIDLTNTKRYYDPIFFQKMGVEYEKLMIPGHETPHKALVNKFIKLVKEFLQNNPDNDKLIGVHCTHGVNRTGYMICNYMISELTIDPKEAISRFANARGHTIERINYINDLHKLLPSNDLKSNMELSPKTSNCRKREGEILDERKDEQKQKVSAQINNRRDRDEALRRYQYNRKKTLNRYNRRSRSKSAELDRRDRYGGSRRSPNRYCRRSRSKSPKAYRRGRYGSSGRSPNRYNSRTRSPHNRGSFNKYHYQINNRVSEMPKNSYQHLPETREDVINRRPALCTDYYATRPMSGRQRTIERYRYI